VAAINMVFGAAVVGVRSITSSSSPGISLMQEGFSYLAGAELPAVIVNIMRGGPGLGNIGPSQADYFQATRGGGHGDYHMPVLAPASVQELVDHIFLAFDLADKYRNPVIILGDGVLGQIVEPVEIGPREESDLPSKDWALTGCRGRAPNKIRSLILGENELLKHNYALQEKYRTIEKNEIRYENVDTADAEILLVAYGTPSRTCRAVLKKYRGDGYRMGLFRPISLWPFPYQALADAARSARAVLVVEMSAGQFVQDVRLAIHDDQKISLLGKPGGEVIQISEVEAEVEKLIALHKVKRR
jgi:2-oxoglutarate ferredoxin oxidoreductase subunit alpha